MALKRSSDRTFVTVLVLAACVLRVFALGRDDFWSDEVHTFEALALPPMELVRERLAAGHLPLYFLLLDAWSAVAGVSETALRLPAALLGAVAVVPAWAVSRRLLASDDGPGGDAARWATGAVAFHPLLVELSREARMYPLLLVAFLLLLLGLLRVLDGEPAPWWLWGAAVVGGLTHATWAFAVVPLAAWFWFESRDLDQDSRGARRRLALTACGLSVALLGLGLLGAAVQQPELTRRPWPRELGVYVLRQVCGAGIRDRYLLLYAATFVAAVGVTAIAWRGVVPRARRFALWLLVGVHGSSAVAALLLGVAWGPVRYVSLAAVALAVLVGAAASRTWVGWGLAALLACCVGLRLGMVRTEWSDGAGQLRRGEPLSLPIGAKIGPGERVVLDHYLAHPR